MSAKVGQLIIAPFRSSSLYGVIAQISDASADQKERGTLKELIDIVIPEPIVSKKYLAFLCEMSELYGISTATLLKMGMMPLQKRKLSTVGPVALPVSQKKILATNNVLTYENEQMHAKCILENCKGTTLILVPEIYEAKKIYEFFPDEVKRSTVIWHSKLSVKEQFDCWFKIRNGEPRVIIGTRASILLPFFKLDSIIIDYEHDENHKQHDQAPRFHVKDVAADVAEMHNAEIIYMSYVLSIDTYFKIQKKAMPYNSKEISAPKILFKKRPNPALIFEKTAEAGSKHFTAVNPALQQKLLNAMDNERDVFIFINRKDALQSKDADQQKFRITTHMVELEIAPLLAHTKYQVARIEKDAEFEKKADAPCVIIGTQAAFPHVDWNKTDLIMYLDIDRQLALSEMNASEHVWSLIWRALYYKHANAELIIQTKIPDHVIFRSLGEPDRFYRTELSNRQQHGYPPYTYVVRYYYRDAQYENAQKYAKMVHETVREALTKMAPGCTLTSLFELHSGTPPADFCIGFAIKFSNFDKEMLKAIHLLIPDRWKIDPHPQSLTSL